MIILELRVLALTKRHVGSGNEIGFLSNPDIFRLRSFEFAAEPSIVILDEVLTTKGVDVWELL